jgi:hypothetical protein
MLMSETGADTHSSRRTAVEEVRIKTPPSGLALKVGKAALKRWKLLLTLIDQHYCLLAIHVLVVTGLNVV